MYCKYIKKKAFKNYLIFEGGGNQKITEDYKGGGKGGFRPPKLDYVIVECSLNGMIIIAVHSYA